MNYDDEDRERETRNLFVGVLGFGLLWIGGMSYCGQKTQSACDDYRRAYDLSVLKYGDTNRDYVISDFERNAYRIQFYADLQIDLNQVDSGCCSLPTGCKDKNDKLLWFSDLTEIITNYVPSTYTGER